MEVLLTKNNLSPVAKRVPFLSEPRGIIVVGDSGDLAKKKIFPAIFSFLL